VATAARGTLTYPLLQVLSNLVVKFKSLLKLLKLLIRRFSGVRDDVEVRWWAKANDTTGETSIDAMQIHTGRERQSAVFHKKYRQRGAPGPHPHHSRPHRHSAELAA